MGILVGSSKLFPATGVTTYHKESGEEEIMFTDFETIHKILKDANGHPEVVNQDTVKKDPNISKDLRKKVGYAIDFPIDDSINRFSYRIIRFYFGFDGTLIHFDSWA